MLQQPDISKPDVIDAASLSLNTFKLFFSGFAAEIRPEGSLESRITRFLEEEPNTVSLDGPAFDQVNGSATKADYLIGEAAPDRRTQDHQR